jgi:ferredoxin
MKAEVDPELCAGCGLCEEVCPEVFEMTDHAARVKVDEVPRGSEETCREAAEGCPMDAISIDERAMADARKHTCVTEP